MMIGTLLIGVALGACAVLGLNWAPKKTETMITLPAPLPISATEVDRFGDFLNIEPMVAYLPAEKARELNDALLQQRRLRQLAGIE